MTLPRLAKAVMIAIGSAPVCLLLVSIVWAVVDNALTVYPTPETQSAFLRTYTPARVFERFRSSKHCSHEGDAAGSGAGRGYATHQKEFEPFFVMQSRERAAFMAALAEDISSGLASTGAKIVAESGDTTDGYQFRYSSGKSIGSVTIEPPKDVDQSQVTGHEPLCPGEAPISIHIRIEEKWVKAGV